MSFKKMTVVEGIIGKENLLLDLGENSVVHQNVTERYRSRLQGKIYFSLGFNNFEWNVEGEV